jgi:hypothetical protein
MVDDGSEVCCYRASSNTNRIGHHDNTLLNVTSPGSEPSYYTRHTADMLTGVAAVTNSVPKARVFRLVLPVSYRPVWLSGNRMGFQSATWSRYASLPGDHHQAPRR